MTLGNMSMPQQLPDDGAILALYQGIVVTMPGAGLCQCDIQFVQQLGNLVVDIL